MDFAIVLFTNEEDAPGIVSTNWIDSSHKTCFYPNSMSEAMKNKLLKAHASPKEDWLVCSIRILKKFSSYDSARKHLREAEETSNLETDSETMMRKRRRKIKSSQFSDLSSDDESQSLLQSRMENYPPPPITFTLSSEPQLHTISNSNPPAVATLQTTKNEISDLKNKLEEVVKTQRNIWLLIEELIAANRRIEGKLDACISNQVQPNVSREDEEEASVISSLPLGCEAFLILDKKIVECSGFRKRLLHLLMSISGRDVKSLVCNLMRRILTDETGEKYSLTGRSKDEIKLPFEKTATYKLIFEICIRNFKDQKINIIREAISDWLMQAKFRKSRREKRSEARAI